MLLINQFGTKFDVDVGDEVSFSPYPDVWYTVYKFNIFADVNLVAVSDGTDILSKDLRCIINRRVPAKLETVVTKPKRERGARLKAAIDNMESNVR